jgi:hypothetical protein
MFKTIEIEGEKVHLKKSVDGWRVVHPIKIDGKINWMNLIFGGSIWNFIKLLAILGVIFLIIWSYKTDMANCTQFAYDIINSGCRNIPINIKI